MIVSHRKKFIFVANGKTGTEAIETALRPYDDEPDLVCGAEGLFTAKHAPAAVIRELIGGARWSQYFKFGFVRHPVDRFLSVWRHYIRDSELDVQRFVRHPRSTFRFWRHNVKMKVPPIPALVRPDDVLRIVQLHAEVRLRLDCVTSLQYPMFYDAADELCVDFIGRYETLGADLTIATQRIGIPMPNVPVVNVGKGRRDSVEFSEEAARLVQEIYREDFKRFKYDFAERSAVPLTQPERTSRPNRVPTHTD